MHLNLFYCCVIFVIEKRTLVQIIAAKLEILISFQKNQTPHPQNPPHCSLSVMEEGRIRKHWFRLGLCRRKIVCVILETFCLSVCLLVCFPVQFALCMEIKLFDTATTKAGSDHCEFMYYQKENKQKNIYSRLMQRWKWARSLLHKRNPRYLQFYFGYGHSCLFRSFSTATTVLCCL